MQNYNSKFKISKLQKQFKSAMEDDFNTPQAMAAVFEAISAGNSLIDKNLLGKNEAESALGFLREIDGFLNFIFWKKPKEKAPKAVLDLVKDREEYRKKRDWEKADQMRKKIIKLGWWLEDTKSGPKIKKLV